MASNQPGSIYLQDLLADEAEGWGLFAWGGDAWGSINPQSMEVADAPAGSVQVTDAPAGSVELEVA